MCVFPYVFGVQVLPGMVGNLRPKPDFLYHYDAKGRAGNIVRDQPPDLPSPLRSAVLRHAAHELAGGSAAAVAAAAGAVTSNKSNNQGSVASSMRRPPSPIAAGKASSLKRELAEGVSWRSVVVMWVVQTCLDSSFL